MAEDSELHFVTMRHNTVINPLYYDFGIEYEFDIENPIKDLILKNPAANK